MQFPKVSFTDALMTLNTLWWVGAFSTLLGAALHWGDHFLSLYMLGFLNLTAICVGFRAVLGGRRGG